MAKLKGPFSVQGKLGDFVFVNDRYRTVRMAPKNRSHQLKYDPRFSEVRKIQNEFGLASSIGKSIRNKMEPYTTRYKDITISGRLTACIFQLIKQDHSPKGQRVCKLAESGSILEGFEFNLEHNRLKERLEIDIKQYSKKLVIWTETKRKFCFKNDWYLDIVVLSLPKIISRQEDLEVVNAFAKTITLSDYFELELSKEEGKVMMLFCGLHRGVEQISEKQGMQLCKVFY